MIREFHCLKCKDTTWVNGKGCRDCCEHEFDPDEGYMCLHCGEAGVERLADQADWLYDCERDRKMTEGE